MPKRMDEKTVSPFVAASHLEMALCSGMTSTTWDLGASTGGVALVRQISKDKVLC